MRTVLFVLAAGLALAQPKPEKSALDKATLEAYLRNVELFLPTVTAKLFGQILASRIFCGLGCMRSRTHAAVTNLELRPRLIAKTLGSCSTPQLLIT